MRFGATSARESRFYSGAPDDLTDYFGPPDLSRAAKHRAIYSQIKAPGSVVALRFDDNPTADYSTVFPLLRDRALPAGFAVNTGTINTSGRLTTAQMLEMQGRGMEFMNHSHSHGAAPTSIDAFRTEAISNKVTLEALGLFIDSFVLPGTWVTDPYDFTSLTDFDSEPGRLLRANYASMDALIVDNYNTAGGMKPMPQHLHYGHTHAITATDTNTLATLTGYVDKAVERRGSAVRFVFHSADIGGSGKLSLANFTALLDYIQTRRDDGRLDVLSPTSMVFAQRGARENLIEDGGFEEQATGAYKYWKAEAGAPVVAANGVTGNALQVSSGNTISQAITSGNFRRVLFVGKARPMTAATTATHRTLFRTYDAVSANPVSHSLTGTAAADAWTTVRHLFGSHPTGVFDLLWLAYSSGDNYRWDDVALYKV